MSTELFRKYINILKESADLTQLTQSLAELETVLNKYKDKIHESLTEAPRSPEQQAAMDALRRGETSAPAPASAPGDLPRGGSRNPTRDWRSPITIADQAAREAEAVRQQQEIARLEKEIAELNRVANGELKPGTRRSLKGIALTLAAGAALYLAPKAWDLVTGVYQSFVKYKFDDLAPGDQEIIRKNIPIIQPYYEQEQFSQLPSSLQTRLITVAVQLGKLKASLILPNNQLPLTRSQEIDAAHTLVKENAYIRDQMQQLTQLSDVEQMALLRALVNEGWYDDAKSAYNSTVGAIDSAASSVWNSDILRYLGWPVAVAGSATAGGYLWSLWKIFSQDYDEKAKAATGTSATAAAPEVPAAPETGPRILGPDGKPLPPSRPAAPARTPVPEIDPPRLGSPKLAAFKKFLGTIAGGKKKALQAILASVLTSLAGWGLWTAAGVNTGVEVAKDVGKWANNDEDAKAEQVIKRLVVLNKNGQFWDDNFVSEEDRRRMLEVVINKCNRYPKDPGCAESKANLCSLMDGLKGC